MRDETSAELLAGLGIGARLTADPALLLAPPATEQAAHCVLVIPRGGFPELTPRLAEAASLLLAAGRGVAAMAIQENEDGPELDRLARLAPGVRRLRVHTPEQALEAIAASGHVISARLHGLVLAAVCGRSMSGIVYDPKVASFLAEAGAPAHPLAPDPALLCEEASARAAPEAALLARLRRRAEGGLDWLADVLEGGAGPPKTGS